MITLYAEQKKKDTDLQNSLLDSVGEGEGGMVQEKSIETCILSRVKQITSPGWMHETSARTWCTGKTQRERVGREVGGGIRMGNTCKPMAVSFQCMTKFTTYKKKEKKKKRLCLPVQGLGSQDLTRLTAKNQNMKQKQSCNKFNKALRKKKAHAETNRIPEQTLFEEL